MRRSGAPRPLVLGPDRLGNSAVFAGDRTCWFGVGDPPQAPGALHLVGAGGTIRSGQVARGRPGELSAAVTTVVVAGDPGEVVAQGGEGRRLGLRVVLVVEVANSVDEEAALAVHFANRDPLVRVAFFGVRALRLCRELGLTWVGAWGDLTALAARSFGRDFRLGAGAVGDVVVMDADGSVRHACVAGAPRIHGGALQAEASIR